MKESSRSLGTFRLFLAILIFSPLAFGAVEDWSLAVIEVASLSALLYFYLRVIARKSLSYKVPGVIPLFLLFLYYLFQITPLPPNVLRFLSPETYRLYSETAGLSGPMEWVSISVYKKDSLLELLRFTAYVSFYVLTVQLLTKKRLLKETAVTITMFSFLLALFSIFQRYFFFNNKIYWVRELTGGGTPFGPFVNKNHFAGFMEMVFPIALALFLTYKPEVTYKTAREGLGEFFTHAKTNFHILAGLACIIIATSVFLTLSRGGIISLSLSLIFFGIMLIVKKKSTRRGTIIISLCLLIILSVGWFGWEPIFARFGNVLDDSGEISDLRLTLWEDSIGIIRAFPLTGTGLGSFVHIYPLHNSVPVKSIVDHAHNDYLEYLVEGGGIGVFLFSCFLFTVVFTSIRTMMRRRESYSYYLFAGCSSGIIAILIHSATDFNLHIGSNGLYFFFLTGLMVSASHTRLRNRTNRTHLRPQSSRYALMICMVIVPLLAATIAFNGGIFIGKYYITTANDINIEKLADPKDISTVKDVILRAIYFDPLEPKYRYAIARAEWLMADKTSAIDNYKYALRLDPLNGEYLQTLGLALPTDRPAELAETMLKTGIDIARNNPARYKTYASWLLENGRRDEGIYNITKAISIEPDKTDEYISMMILYGLSDDEIHSSMPGITKPHICFASYLAGTEKETVAAGEYLHAMEYLGKEKVPDRSNFMIPAQFFIIRGMHNEGLLVMQKAVEALPDDPGIRAMSAQVLDKAGYINRAVEEYNKALLLDPDNLAIINRLRALKPDIRRY